MGLLDRLVHRIRARGDDGDSPFVRQYVRNELNAALERGELRQVVIQCDRCLVQHVADYIGPSEAERIYEARLYLSTRGWSVGRGGDICPPCQTSPPVEPPPFEAPAGCRLCGGGEVIDCSARCGGDPSCGACQGDGVVACPNCVCGVCDNDGIIRCPVRCTGEQVDTCVGCQGRGYTECPSCGG